MNQYISYACCVIKHNYELIFVFVGVYGESRTPSLPLCGTVAGFFFPTLHAATLPHTDIPAKEFAFVYRINFRILQLIL